MDRYTARINLHGITRRERAKNRLKEHLNNRIPNSLSHKDVLLNGVKTNLIINSGTQPYYKEFQSLPDQEINIGDYVEWANSHWIVTVCDYDDEIYRDGKLEQCNYLLKWQNDLGEIIERWAIIRSASKYNDGLSETENIILGSDKLSIIVPLDSEAIKLKKAMSKKFLIDYNKKDPTAYLLANTGNVPDTYNGHGITSWIVEEIDYTASEYDLRFGVCDYIAPTISFEDTHKTTFSNNSITGTILGSKNLKIGVSRKYKVNLVDTDGRPVKWSGGFSWSIVSEFDVSSYSIGEEIELLIDNEEYQDKSFVLSVVNDNTTVAQIEITVVGLM